MKTHQRVLALAGVAVFLGLGAWLLFGAPEEPAPTGREISDRPAEPTLPPPVLRPRGGEPVRAPDPVVPDDPAPKVVLTVLILDDARGHALDGAEVTVTQGEDGTRVFRTNDAGIVEIADLRAGEVHVLARAPGFVRAEVQQELAGTESAAIELRLARGVVLEGTVVAEHTGLTVAGASVVVVPGGSIAGWTEMSLASPFGNAQTDERGHFVVDGVAPGVLLTARATAEGFGVASKSMELAPAADVPAHVVLRLPPAAMLGGTVRLAGGEPAVEARVYAVPADAPEMLLANPEGHCSSNGRSFRSLRGVTDGDGVFVIDGLELGALHIVFAELAGHGRSAMKEGVVATEEDPRPHVDLVLQGAASLTVRVWSPDGEPQEEGRLLLFGDGFPLEFERQSPGVFVVREPPPGTYTLRVRCVGAVVQEFPVEIAPAEQEEMEVRLDRGLVLAGVLVDDTGHPIAHQKLWVDRPWQESGKHPPSEGAAETDDEGRFVIGGLREGPHALGLVLGRHVVPEDLRLEPPGEDLRIVVLRKAGLRVRLELPAGCASPELVGVRVGREESGGFSESGHSVSWSEGELLFGDLAPGASRVRIQVEGLLEVVRNPTLKPGEVVDLGTIVMEAGFELEGRVVDREDRPVVGACVTAGEIWTVMHRAVVTGADGRFVLPILARGENEIEITATGFLMRTVTVVAPEELTGRSFVLDHGCLVTVRVSSADGKPVPARRVQWRPLPVQGEADGPTDSDETDAKGRLEVRLPEGAWTFEVLDDEWNPITVHEVELREGGAAMVEFTLPR